VAVDKNNSRIKINSYTIFILFLIKMNEEEQPIDFDLPITITTVKTYTQFYIKKINIVFGKDAEVNVILFDTVNSIPLYETILIPVEVYTLWQYDQEQIITYCKNYLQTKFSIL
jgi:hypothetical protein